MAKQNRLPSVDDQYLPVTEPTAAPVAVAEPLARREPQPPQSDLAAAIADEAEQKFLVADDILAEIVINQQSVANFEQVMFFNSLGWDKPEIGNQIRRKQNVLQQQAIAGDTLLREASLQEACTAAQLLAEQGPKIQEEITRLQQTLQTLERDNLRATKRVEEQRLALDRLKKLMPRHIQEKINIATQAYKGTVRKKLHEVQIRLRELTNVMVRENYQYAYDHFDAMRRAFPTRSMNNDARSQWNPEAWFGIGGWEDLQREIRKETRELIELEAELAAVVAEREKEIEELKEYYWR